MRGGEESNTIGSKPYVTVIPIELRLYKRFFHNDSTKAMADEDERSVRYIFSLSMESVEQIRGLLLNPIYRSFEGSIGIVSEYHDSSAGDSQWKEISQP